MPSTVRNLFGKEVLRLAKGEKGVGCFFCPLDKVPGIVKIKGLDRIKRRKVFLWTQSPGRQENIQGLELVGPAGRFLWETASLFGFKRSDFDIQNTCRCRPTDNEDKDRNPTKEELRCCSIYNEQALELNQGEADVHLICGEIAGKQLLKKAYRKDTPVFWYKPWNAYVVLNTHPSYVLRLGGKEAGGAYLTFRDRFRAVRAILDHPGRWGYVKSRDYGPVDDSLGVERLLDTLYAEASAGRRVSVDLEDGVVDGRNVPLMVGFGWGHFTKKGDLGSWEGGARSVILEHPENKKNKSRLPLIKERLAQVIADPKLEKVFQHGSYDEDPIEKYFGVKLGGYVYDTQYAAFLKDSNLRSYSLASMIRYWFPEFADYKTEMVKEWNSNFAEAPLDRLVIYNCADCDIPKRIEDKIGSSISLPLLQTYIQDAFVIDGMESRGPVLDWEEHARLSEEVPKLLEPLTQQLRILAEDSNFNPAAPAQVAKLLFDKLKLPHEGRSTQADTLELLHKQTGHPAPKLVIQWRALNVIKNTFLVGYAKSAERNNGELHTIWHLTGAATGRLRSGKGEEAEREGIVNLQNTHGNKIMQNLMVSDPNWRLALKGK